MPSPPPPCGSWSRPALFAVLLGPALSPGTQGPVSPHASSEARGPFVLRPAASRANASSRIGAVAFVVYAARDWTPPQGSGGSRGPPPPRRNRRESRARRVAPSWWKQRRSEVARDCNPRSSPLPSPALLLCGGGGGGAAAAAGGHHRRCVASAEPSPDPDCC